MSDIRSSLGSRSIPRHWLVRLDIKEGWRNSRRNDDSFRVFFIKIGWKLKLSSWNTFIGRRRPKLHGPGLIGLIKVNAF